MSAPHVEAAHLVVRRGRTTVPPRVGQHLLATRGGIELLGLALAAGRHWQALTERQRVVLREAYRAGVAALPADVPDGAVVPAPQLSPGAHPATVRALERKGLVADGRITALAAEIVAYTVDVARPVRTEAPRGGHL